MFDALSDGGEVAMPPQEALRAEGFGALTDRLGTLRMIDGARAAS